MADPEEEGRLMPLKWHIPESIVSRYATNIVVQKTEHEFIISFFEIHQPLLFGTPEQQKATLDSMESVTAECVAKIIVSEGRMQEFVQVLQNQLNRHLSKQQSME